MRGFAKGLWVLGWVLIAGWGVGALTSGVGPFEVITLVISILFLVPFLAIRSQEKSQQDTRAR